MRKRTRLIFWFLLALILVALGTSAVVRVTRPIRPADRLVGSWEGEGEQRGQFEVGTGKGNLDASLSLRTTSSLKFSQDGMLNWSLRAEAEGFKFAFTVPDPKKPDAVARWDVLRAERESLVVRLIGPDGPEYSVAFNGNDEFTMTPIGPDKSSGPIVFRRVRAGN